MKVDSGTYDMVVSHITYLFYLQFTSFVSTYFSCKFNFLPYADIHTPFVEQLSQPLQSTYSTTGSRIKYKLTVFLTIFSDIQSFTTSISFSLYFLYISYKSDKRKWPLQQQLMSRVYLIPNPSFFPIHSLSMEFLQDVQRLDSFLQVLQHSPPVIISKALLVYFI